MKSKKKVLVALSGGVDSAVAAYLLKRQGFDVTGAFLKMWSDTKNAITGECSWRDDYHEALKVSEILGIPLITLDFEVEYKKLVVDEMFKLYKLGVTPNPDVDCNRKIKFPLLLRAAKNLGCDFISTGHYSRIKKVGKKYYLLRGFENLKDQSYFLYHLNQEVLSCTIFPIGDYKKFEVRKIAKKLKLPNWNRKSTVGICFIGKVNLKDFLKKKIKPKSGIILDANNNILGEHDGIYYYTIGQRLGMRYGIDVNRNNLPSSTHNKRWYIAGKNAKTNTLIVAPEGHPSLLRNSMFLKEFHLISEDIKVFKNKISKKALNVNARIRKVGELLPAKLSFKDNKYLVILNKPVTGISEGQALVIYKKDSSIVIGGGVII